MSENKNTVDDILTPPIDSDVDVKKESADKKTTDTKSTAKKTESVKKTETAKKSDSEKTASKEDTKVTEKQVETSTGTELATDKSNKLTAGTEFTANRLVRIYPTSDMYMYTNTRSGKMYVYADGVVNGRIRLTDDIEKVGQPFGCIGWASVDAVMQCIE